VNAAKAAWIAARPATMRASLMTSPRDPRARSAYTSDAHAADARRAAMREAGSQRPLGQPFGHFRLTAFFLVVATGVAIFTVFRASAHEGAFEREEAVRLAVESVVLCAVLTFAGVLFHRLRVIPLRWKETQEYLAAIRRESAKYRALMEGAADLLLVVEPRTGAVREAGARAREEFGLHEETALRGGADNIRACVAPEDGERLFAALARASEGPDARASLEDVRLVTARGEARIADARLAAVDVEHERLVQVSLRDVTHAREMERSLRVHERLSSIGLLTAGVAHEINNPLEGIGNYLKLLERHDLPPDQRAKYLDLVRHGFARIGEIVRDLLHFARAQPGSGTADLAAAAGRAAKLAAYSEKLRGVEIAVGKPEKPLVVQGDEGRLEQVLVNLLLNAGAAMQGKGRITVGVRHVPSTQGSRPEVELVVDDEGPGIKDADLARIFDPFFTTTGGTGLGLSVSYGIVAAHGGRIWAENRSEGGARFTIRLPARSDAP
jgi:signal transduction histidine kinase